MNKKVILALVPIAGLALGILADRRLTKTGAAVAARPVPSAAAQAPPPALAAPSPAPARQVEDPKAVYRVPLEDSPVRGPKDALVTIVEASDLECTFCKRVAPTLKQVEEAYRGKVRFVFKHNPLGMHANAVPAALVAEEARAEGGDAKFWEAREKLLELPSLDRASLEGAAKALGLSAEKVKVALDGTRQVERLRRDQNLLNALGARGTPTFFVNGRKLVGAVPFEAFKGMIDEELAKARELVKQGVKPPDLYARITEKGATVPVMIAAPAQPAPGAAPGAAAKIPVRADDPAKGPAAAPVTVVLFSDFQCPFCSRVGPTLKQIEQAYPSNVRITWKHLPLAFHANALPAAKAADAARAQGKFWEMHDRLFAGQQALSDAAYVQNAKELGLDAGRFQKDAASEATAKRIAEDQQLAGSAGATGTPTLFVNCRKVVGAQPFEAFKAVIDEELAKAAKRTAQGEKLDAGFYDRICAANVAAAPAAAAPAAPKDVKVALRPDDPGRRTRRR